jgi:glycosyltransferase involved in cell wall biosynthesis
MMQERQYLYLSNYMFGGCVNFTAHLLHSLRKKCVLILMRTRLKEPRRGDFGYNIYYEGIPMELFDSIKNPFITDMFKNFHLLQKLKRNDITIVIHDPGEIFKENEPYLKYWNIICIRRIFQKYLENIYNLNPKFLYHPFYPYPIQRNDDNNLITKTEAVSISRIDYGKHLDIALNANKLIKLKNNNNNNSIKIYGWVNSKYVHHELEREQFSQCYHGKFKKSFSAISKILSKAKFMVDLSVIQHDGGGTQYTFLEAIHNDTALIINRKWIEDVDPKYRDFKEGYNCYAVSNEKELAELIINSKNIDTTKIVHNAKKLMERHIKADWSSL